MFGYLSNFFGQTLLKIDDLVLDQQRQLFNMTVESKASEILRETKTNNSFLSKVADMQLSRSKGVESIGRVSVQERMQQLHLSALKRTSPEKNVKENVARANAYSQRFSFNRMHYLSLLEREISEREQEQHDATNEMNSLSQITSTQPATSLLDVTLESLVHDKFSPKFNPRDHLPTDSGRILTSVELLNAARAKNFAQLQEKRGMLSSISSPENTEKHTGMLWTRYMKSRYHANGEPKKTFTRMEMPGVLE